MYLPELRKTSDLFIHPATHEKSEHLQLKHFQVFDIIKFIYTDNSFNHNVSK